MHQAVIDTGAPACILPKRIWNSLDSSGEITWVVDPPATVAVGGLVRVLTVLGNSYPFRVARVNLEVLDFGDGHLPPREVLAICTEDILPTPNPLPLILGLSEVLEGRALLLQVSDDGQKWAAMMHEP
jgi:hypothetical protein